MDKPQNRSAVPFGAGEGAENAPLSASLRTIQICSLAVALSACTYTEQLTMEQQYQVMIEEGCAPPVGEPIVWIDPCPGQVTCSLPDLDQDGIVGVNDFLDLLSLWGPSDCTIYRHGDINVDGEVGVEDLLIILEFWGVYNPATWDRCDC